MASDVIKAASGIGSAVVQKLNPEGAEYRTTAGKKLMNGLAQLLITLSPLMGIPPQLAAEMTAIGRHYEDKQ